MNTKQIQEYDQKNSLVLSFVHCHLVDWNGMGTKILDWIEDCRVPTDHQYITYAGLLYDISNQTSNFCQA